MLVNDGDFFWQSVSFDLASYCFWSVMLEKELHTALVVDTNHNAVCLNMLLL